MKSQVARSLRGTVLMLWLAVAAPAQLTFQFDYTYDTGFFTGGNAGRQTYLTAVGSYLTNLISATQLAAITPGGGNSWNANIFDPRDVGATLNLGNISVTANTIVVYVGAYNLGGSTLGIGGPGGYGASGNLAWFDTLSYRGNGSFNMPAVGAITFNSTTDWHFDNDVSTTETFAGQSDFFSVAAHELFHLLGFGTSSIWQGLISGTPPTSVFTGTASVAANGGNVLLDPGNGHWVNGTLSTIYSTATQQETLMDPSILVGTRKYATELDVAGLADLGYTVTAVPEPGTYALLFGIVMTLVVVRRRRVA